jgi:hypothetical protein
VEEPPGGISPFPGVVTSLRDEPIEADASVFAGTSTGFNISSSNGKNCTIKCEGEASFSWDRRD